MRNLLRKEFCVANIWFGCPDTEAFYLPQWQRLSPAFVLYRLLTAFFTVSCLVNYIISTSNDPDTDHNVMAYLTTWAYIVLVLHFHLAAIITCYWTYKRYRGDIDVSNYTTVIARSRLRKDGRVKPPPPPAAVQLTASSTIGDVLDRPVLETQESVESAVFIENTDQTTWYMKLSWMFYNITFVSAIVVTLVFFGAVYPNLSPEDRKAALGISFEDLSVHGLNTLLVLMEVALSAYPVRLLHALYPILYGLLYMIFNISYWSFDMKHNIIYEGMLDWNHPIRCLILVVALVFFVTPLLQIVHFLFYKLRDTVFNRTSRQDSISTINTGDV